MYDASSFWGMRYKQGIKNLKIKKWYVLLEFSFQVGLRDFVAELVTVA